jgi:hypothetical protein
MSGPERVDFELLRFTQSGGGGVGPCYMLDGDGAHGCVGSMSFFRVRVIGTVAGISMECTNEFDLSVRRLACFYSDSYLLSPNRRPITCDWDLLP